MNIPLRVVTALVCLVAATVGVTLWYNAGYPLSFGLATYQWAVGLLVFWFPVPGPDGAERLRRKSMMRGFAAAGAAALLAAGIAAMILVPELRTRFVFVLVLMTVPTGFVLGWIASFVWIHRHSPVAPPLTPARPGRPAAA
jgi:hypothetical protein